VDCIFSHPSPWPSAPALLPNLGGSLPNDVFAEGLCLPTVIDPSGRRASRVALAGAAALLPVSLGPAIFGGFGPVYAIAATGAGLGYLVAAAQFRIRTDDHDFDFKVRHILRFLEEGDKVKVVVMFRGREVVHRDLGFKIFEEVLSRVAEKCIVEKPAGIDGRDMHAIISPRPVDINPKKPKEAKPSQEPQNA
jgi:hypothetical protein